MEREWTTLRQMPSRKLGACYVSRQEKQGGIRAQRRAAKERRSFSPCWESRMWPYINRQAGRPASRLTVLFLHNQLIQSQRPWRPWHVASAAPGNGRIRRKQLLQCRWYQGLLVCINTLIQNKCSFRRATLSVEKRSWT